MDKISFSEVRNVYRSLRSSERNNLRRFIEYYLNESYEGVVRTKGPNVGSGGKNYTSGGKIKEYDLSDWLYFEGSFKYEERYWHFIITMQSVEQDNNQNKVGNIHVLMDRVGIIVDEIEENEHLEKVKSGGIGSYSKERYSLGDWYNAVTEYDLPLDIDVNSFENEINNPDSKALKIAQLLFSSEKRISTLN